MNKTNNEKNNAKFVSLDWEPSSGPTLLQGIKRSHVPSNTIRGGNGSYLVADSAKLILTLETDSGKMVSKDIYFDVKDLTDERITKKFRNNLEDYLENQTFEVKDRETNISEVLEKYFD